MGGGRAASTEGNNPAVGLLHQGQIYDDVTLVAPYRVLYPSPYDAPRGAWLQPLRFVFQSDRVAEYNRLENIPPELQEPDAIRVGNLQVARARNARPGQVGVRDRFEVEAGEVVDYDIDVCLSEVRMGLRSTDPERRLYNPRIDTSGTYHETFGFAGEKPYTAGGSFRGVPTVSAHQASEHARQDAWIHFPIAEGAHTLTPRASVYHDGSSSNLTFSELDLAVGCGQTLFLYPGMGIAAQASCTEGDDGQRILADVSSDGRDIGRIWYTVDGTSTEVCGGETATACEPDQSLDLFLPAEDLQGACEHVVAIHAEIPEADLEPIEISTSLRIAFDHPLDGVTCDDAACGPGAVDITATAQCDTDDEGVWLSVDVDPGGNVLSALELSLVGGDVLYSSDGADPFVDLLVTPDQVEACDHEVQIDVGLEGYGWAEPAFVSFDLNNPEDGIECGEDTCGPPNVEEDDAIVGGCTYTQGYWRNHPHAWPLSSLKIGGETYSAAQAMSWLTTPPRGDATVLLVRQLIPARLNAEIAESAVVQGTMDAADDLLAEIGLGNGRSVRGSARGELTDLAGILDDYNNGLIGPGHCDD